VIAPEGAIMASIPWLLTLLAGGVWALALRSVCRDLRRETMAGAGLGHCGLPPAPRRAPASGAR
jgi:hypothetical protein